MLSVGALCIRAGKCTSPSAPQRRPSGFRAPCSAPQTITSLGSRRQLPGNKTPLRTRRRLRNGAKERHGLGRAPLQTPGAPVPPGILRLTCTDQRLPSTSGGVRPNYRFLQKGGTSNAPPNPPKHQFSQFGVWALGHGVQAPAICELRRAKSWKPWASATPPGCCRCHRNQHSVVPVPGARSEPWVSLDTHSPPHAPANAAGWQVCLLQGPPRTGRVLSQPRVPREPRQQPAPPAQRGYGRLQFPEAVQETEGSPRREKPGWQL